MGQQRLGGPFPPGMQQQQQMRGSPPMSTNNNGQQRPQMMQQQRQMGPAGLIVSSFFLFLTPSSVPLDGKLLSFFLSFVVKKQKMVSSCAFVLLFLAVFVCT